MPVEIQKSIIEQLEEEPLPTKPKPSYFQGYRTAIELLPSFELERVYFNPCACVTWIALSHDEEIMFPGEGLTGYEFKAEIAKALGCNNPDTLLPATDFNINFEKGFSRAIECAEFFIDQAMEGWNHGAIFLLGFDQNSRTSSPIVSIPKT